MSILGLGLNCHVRTVLCVGLMSKSNEQLFYAVGVGRQVGIYNTWNECKSQVHGVKNPKFRKFHTLAEAEEFVKFWKNKLPSPNKSSADGKSCTSPSSPNVNTVQRQYSKASNLERLKKSGGDEMIYCKKIAKNEKVNVADLQERISSCEKKIDFYINGLTTIISGLKDLKGEFGQINAICKNNSEYSEGESNKLCSKAGTSKENCGSFNSRDGGLFGDTSKSEEVSVEDFDFSEFEECKTSVKRKRSSSSEDAHGDGCSKRNKKLLEASSTKSLKGSASFTKDEEDYVAVYTDGCCLRNGSSAAKAGIGIWFGDNHPLNVSEPFKGVRPTNNNAEIQAARIAIETALEANIPKLKIITDSQFLISSATEWLPKWKMNNWITGSKNEVVNRRELEKLDKVMSLLSVRWEKVAGHRGIHGNEAADRLANEGAALYVDSEMA